MARLIDADALEAKLEEQRKLYIDMDMKGAEHLLVHDVLHYVWEAPTIDAVPSTIEGALGYLHKVGWMQEHDRIMTEDVAPVVRCKDCKGSEVFQNDSSGVMARYCKAFTLKRMVADDDFCSYGERKDND